jgi:hypothetical protein
MPAATVLFQAVLSHVQQMCAPARVRVTAMRRLALLVTGLLAARSAVVAHLAAEVAALGLSNAQEASIARRLRRTLHEASFPPVQVYGAAVRAAVAWQELRQRGRPVVLAVDDSSQADHIHLLRVSLVYRGGALPLAWAVWAQQVVQPRGAYWQAMEQVLAAAATLIPADLAVVVTADRAFDVAAFVDRVAAHGWHWLVRTKLSSQLQFRAHDGQVARLGARFQARGWVFKAAQWRAASVVAVWAPMQPAPLAVLSDLPPHWRLVAQYRQRFWCEAGFRTDKSHGWHWEQCQVRGVVHHDRLLLAMAWATLLVLCVGVTVAAQQCQQLTHRGQPPRATTRLRSLRHPPHARQSLFTLGLWQLRHWLYQPPPAGARLPTCLPAPAAPAWSAQWYAAHALARLPQTVRP